MKLGFIGLGVVGQATYHLARSAGHTDIKKHDPRLGFSCSMSDRDVIFISVPAPTLPTGEVDLSYIKSALISCPESAKIFLRSTVPRGTITTLGLYFSWAQLFALPEFLTERTATTDERFLPFVASEAGASILSDIFPDKKILVLPRESDCEFVKSMHNAYCAMKVGFFNTMHQMAAAGMHPYDACVDAACSVTGFIERTHTKVPGPDGEFGFGGKCLPKDLHSFCTQIERDLGRSTFLRGVFMENFVNRFGALF